MKDLSLSAKCELYRQIYPKAGKCIILSRDESEKLLIALSEQFDLKVVDNNFAAFLAAETNHKSNKQIVMEIYRNLDKTRPLIHNQIPGFYEYDQLHYRWTITPSVVSIPKKELLSGMKIQLSNNRFLYKPAEEYPLKGLTSVGRHKSPNWMMLQSDVLKNLPALMAFVDEYFMLHTNIKAQQVQFCYEEEQNRMDILFDGVSNTFLNIQFEPGFSETYFDEDLWSPLG